MSWIDKIVPAIRKDNPKAQGGSSSVPEGLWKKCPKCDSVLYKPELDKNLDVCPKCQHHMRIGARRRLDIFLDEQGRQELCADVGPVDRLKFKDVKKYKDRLSSAQKATGEKDAIVVMEGHVKGLPVVAVAFEFAFHGGSMGYAVGEKFTRAANVALEKKIPLVCFAASGGARMQEALISLMQMAKTSAVVERMKQQGIPYISFMTDPVYGGVSASLALLGDLNIAEPGARAGFAGPNIIEQTIRQKLPPGFQRSEFLLDHGAIDMIMHRHDIRNKLASILAKLQHKTAPELEPAIDVKAETSSSSAGVTGEAGKGAEGNNKPGSNSTSASPNADVSRENADIKNSASNQAPEAPEKSGQQAKDKGE